MRMSLKIVNKKVKLVGKVELVSNVVKNGNVSVGSTNMLICHICVFVADPRQSANVLSRFSHVSMWYVHMYSHYTACVPLRSTWTVASKCMSKPSP